MQHILVIKHTGQYDDDEKTCLKVFHNIDNARIYLKEQVDLINKSVPANKLVNPLVQNPENPDTYNIKVTSWGFFEKLYLEIVEAGDE